MKAYMGGQNLWSQGTGPFDQGTGLQIGVDNTGRMVGGDFEGMNVAGKSGWGSANFDEMARELATIEFGDVELFRHLYMVKVETTANEQKKLQTIAQRRSNLIDN